MGQARRIRCAAALVATATLSMSTPAATARPPERASCLAQFVAVAAPGGAFGPVVSREARDPETLLNAPSLGAFVRGFAQAPAPCPPVP